MNHFKKIFNCKNIIYFLFLAVFILTASEILLRIHNPFNTRLKGNKIILPTNQTYLLTNKKIPRLDAKIKHTKNSLGFRGEEKPQDFQNYLSIITVGGSTTECFYISDGKTWSDLLGNKLKDRFRDIWINNAGLDGHSTFGHQILLEDYLVHIKPKIIIFLIGCNDVGREDLSRFDQNKVKGYHGHLLNYLSNNSEVMNLALNIYRSWRGMGHKNLVLSEQPYLFIPDSLISKELLRQKSLAASYKERVMKLVETCKANDIDPIFLTQPILFGTGKDSLTGVDLEKIKIEEGLNGKLYWEILELYNAQTKQVGKETSTLVIDLSNLMPKNSHYFYDMVHFTNEGNEKAAEIIISSLSSYLSCNYPNFSR